MRVLATRPRLFGAPMETENPKPGLVAEIVERRIDTENRIQPPPPRVAYSLAEIANMCGVSKRVIETQANTGKLRTKRVGRTLLVTHRELERWLNG